MSRAARDHQDLYDQYTSGDRDQPFLEINARLVAMMQVLFENDLITPKEFEQRVVRVSAALDGRRAELKGELDQSLRLVHVETPSDLMKEFREVVTGLLSSPPKLLAIGSVTQLSSFDLSLEKEWPLPIVMQAPINGVIYLDLVAIVADERLEDFTLIKLRDTVMSDFMQRFAGLHPGISVRFLFLRTTEDQPAGLWEQVQHGFQNETVLLEVATDQ